MKSLIPCYTDWLQNYILKSFLSPTPRINTKFLHLSTLAGSIRPSYATHGLPFCLKNNTDIGFDFLAINFTKRKRKGKKWGMCVRYGGGTPYFRVSGVRMSSFSGIIHFPQTQKLVHSDYNMKITMKRIYGTQWNIIMGEKGAMWFRFTCPSLKGKEITIIHL